MPCRSRPQGIDEYEQMTGMFDVLYPDVPVRKNVWQWVESAQHRLARIGAHRSMSTVDLLLVCATTALHGPVVLHDHHDFVIAARQVTDLVERRVHDTPPAS